MNKISPLAFINPKAHIGDNVTIDAFVFIDEDVVIGDSCHIHPHCSILPGARIGKNNEVFDGAIISAQPQDFRWKGDISYVVTGDNNIIREHVIINRSIHPGGETKIGNDSFIMAQTHVGHDSEIGNKSVIGNAVKIAGNCKIGNCSILSSNALVHEKCEIGDWVLIKGGCRVNNNIPPYTIMAHNPISYYGVNAFIMRRGGFSEESIDNVAKAYRHIYQCNTSVLNALKRVENDIESCDECNNIINFIKQHNLHIAAVNTEYLEE